MSLRRIRRFSSVRPLQALGIGNRVVLSDPSPSEGDISEYPAITSDDLPEDTFPGTSGSDTLEESSSGFSSVTGSSSYGELIIGNLLVSTPKNLEPESPQTASSSLSIADVALGIIFEPETKVSDVCVALGLVVQGLYALIKHHEQSIPNKDDFRRTLLRTESLLGWLSGPSEGDMVHEFERRTDLTLNMTRISAMLEQVLRRDSFPPLDNINKDRIVASLIEDTRDAVADYQMSLEQEIYDRDCKFIVRHVYPTWISLIPPQSQDTLSTLNKLTHANDAHHFSGNVRRCLRGTRTLVLREIEGWAEDRNNGRVYWLNGVAGCGKTTIARSFADYAFEMGKLGASFFCSRDFADRSNLKLIFPTLAFELAYRSRDFRARLVQVIKSTPNIGNASLSDQLEVLLIQPLKSTGLQTIIIIDALDECKDDEPASAILSLLARRIDEIPLVKFFITGRPEPRIRSGFRLPLLRPHTEMFVLHHVEQESVDQDIKKLLSSRLSEIAASRGELNGVPSWPREDDVVALVRKSDGLFIYAETILKLIAADDSPMDRLQSIASTPDGAVDEGSSGLDGLYNQIVEESYVRGVSESFLSRLRLTLATIVLAFNPLSRTSLATLLDVNSSAILSSLRSFHSLILVPDSNSDPIRSFHKSFPDYVTDSSRCNDTRFFVDSGVYHGKVGIKCLELMQSQLRKNICDLPQYVMNNDVSDLSTRRNKCIGDALEYACRFWAKHLSSAFGTDEDDMARILELLNDFVQRHLLAWLEVLSIVGDLRGAVHSLISLEAWLVKIKPPTEGLLDSIRECGRFVLFSFDCIQASAYHIYDSALVWLPKSSLVRTIYEDHQTTKAKLLNSSDTWDACLRSIRVGDDGGVLSVAFSHKGDLVAGGGESRDVQIFEVASGVCVATLSGHHGYVFSIAFSPDDLFLASGAGDKAVRVWDVQTGALVTTLEGHTAGVHSVAFSPDGAMLSSGARDNTVRVWDLSPSRCTRIFRDHTKWVYSVCWLGPNEVVSGSEDNTVKVWNVSVGLCSATFCEHTGLVRSVTCSPDGSKIMSASGSSIHIHHARTGEILQTVFADRKVISVCFSPDGDKIVYGLDILGRTGLSVVVWDLVKKVAILRCDENRVSRVAFAPDGRCVASASVDGFVRVWQVDTISQDADISDRHSWQVTCISLTADGRQIASGSQDRTVKLWDVNTGSCIHTFDGHSDYVRSVAFSPNSSFIASASDDRTVRIWSVPTDSGTTTRSSHTFHGHVHYVNSLAISPDSSLIASGSSDTTVRVWGVQNRNHIKTLKGHSRPVEDVTFSPDGEKIASLSTDQVIVWNVKGWNILAELQVQNMGCYPRVYLPADGTHVIVKSGDKVKDWNIASAKEPFEVGDPRTKILQWPIKKIQTNLRSNSLHLKPEDGFLISHESLLQLYHYPKDGDWVMDRWDNRVCWVPPDRKGSCSYVHGKTVVIGTLNGKVVVLDFSDIS